MKEFIVIKDVGFETGNLLKLWNFILNILQGVKVFAIAGRVVTAITIRNLIIKKRDIVISYAKARDIDIAVTMHSTYFFSFTFLL